MEQGFPQDFGIVLSILSVDFLYIFKVVQKFDKTPSTIVQGILSKFARREFFFFIIFSDAYTCSCFA